METSKKFIFPLFGYGALAVMLGSIVGGLLITGGPDRQRLIRFDETRSEHLNRLETKIERYFEEKKNLPQKLDDLRNLYDTDLTESALVDPVSKKHYNYYKINDNSFKVCTIFQTELLPKYDSDSNNDYYFRNLHYHRKGLRCLSKTIKVPTINHN